ncbi:SURF1 family protein [Ancylobacter radicis]|uniref:SURF1-like protein n=1 Tax=Ancylobacter radicis TaxID=2836179 RepID=A0ABS5R8U1_9HYPH|nr:SURF1 family protein [Ancylobacter radicis]MBS9478083.1 SURF1 family protein [Ancylobacter radicis]
MAAPHRSPLIHIGLIVLLTALTLCFAALGIWQIQRLVWKLDLIARVEARIHAEPAPIPSHDTFMAARSPGDMEYLRVRLDGHFLNDRETLVQAVTELGGGFWVLTPFVTDDGRIVLVNRGFVPPERRDPASRAAGQIAGETQVVGLLRLSEPGGGFLRSNDQAANRWYSRDVEAIAQARQLVDVAPYFVDSERVPLPDGAPVGGLTVVRFTNNHLVYALTWFALAAMSAYAAWRLRGGNRP